jgi:hypothetical protein
MGVRKEGEHGERWTGRKAGLSNNSTSTANPIHSILHQEGFFLWEMFESVKRDDKNLVVGVFSEFLESGKFADEVIHVLRMEQTTFH